MTSLKHLQSESKKRIKSFVHATGVDWIFEGLKKNLIKPQLFLVILWNNRHRELDPTILLVLHGSFQELLGETI